MWKQVDAVSLGHRGGPKREAGGEKKKQNKKSKTIPSLVVSRLIVIFFSIRNKGIYFFFSPHLFGRTFSMEIKNKTKYIYL